MKFETWAEYRAWNARMAEERTDEDAEVPLYTDDPANNEE